MATNLAIDPDLLDKAIEVSGERTKKAAETLALREFIARRKQRRVLELTGKLDWDESCDDKAERSRKFFDLAHHQSRFFARSKVWQTEGLVA